MDTAGTDQDGFNHSRERFEQVLAFMGGNHAAALTHAELEDHLDTRGRELLRQLYQDHLDLRALGEARLDGVADAEGVPRGNVEAGHERTLTTIFGQVTVSRLAYRRRAHPNLHPADAVLNLPAERHSHGLRRLAAVESAKGSFDDATEAITAATGATVGKRQTEDLARRAAVDFDDFYRSAPRPTAAPGDVLVITADGKGVVMHPGALRPATAAAADKANPKLTARLSKGEKRNRKRMATVGAVYDTTPVPRTPEQIFGDDDAPPAPTATGKWLTASVVKDAATVVGQIFDEAARRDPGHERTWVALVDGNNHQIDRITAEATTRNIDVAIVIDFIHVLEYLWRAAWSFFDEGDPAAQDWVTDKALRVLRGQSSTVAAAIRRKATNLGLTANRRANADTCATYLLRKRAHLDYPTRSNKAGPSPPASSKAPADTSSRTGWTSPAPAGDSKEPKPSSSSARYGPTATSTTTGTSTSHKNDTASTSHATPPTPSPRRRDAPSGEPHPCEMAAGSALSHWRTRAADVRIGRRVRIVTTPSWACAAFRPLDRRSAMSVTTRTGHRVPAHEGPAGNGLRALVRTHPLLSYFAVTFLISWGGLLLLMALGPGRMPLTSEEFDPLLPFALLVTVAGPAVAGPLLAGLADGRAGLREFRARLARWRAAPRWYAVALLGGPLAVVAALLPLSLISTDFLPAIVTTENKGGLLLAGLAAGVAAGVLEETGWTGFAVPRLRVHHGVVAAGLLLGMVWGVWHFPVYAAGSGTPTGGLAWEVFGPPAVFFVTVLPVFRVLMIMVYDRVASVPVAMIMHGSLSATAPLILAPQVTGAALATFYVTVAVVLWVVVAAVGIAKRRRPTPSSPGRTPSPSAHAQW